MAPAMQASRDTAAEPAACGPVSRHPAEDLLPRSNPFAAARVRPGRIGYVFPEGESVGRLVDRLAAVGTPCVFADTATDVGAWADGRIGKARMLCSEYGLAYLPSFGSLCHWIDRGETPAARGFPPAYEALFEAMVGRVVDAFASRPAARGE